MKSKTFRISVAAAALGIGVALVLILSLAGNRVRGPLEDFFSFTGQAVNSVEKKLILDQRKNKRANKLQWIQGYAKNSARLKDPDRMLLGAYDNNTSQSFENIINLEDSLQTTFPLIHIYCAWGDKIEQRFPTLQAQSIIELGSIPVITWEPWLTDFDAEVHPELPPRDKREKGGMTDVAKGLYDFYIIQWAKKAKEIKSSMFVRVGHEMNDPYRYPWGPHNNKPKEFIKAWQHIHDVFIQQGVDNVVWVWSPHPAYGMFKDFYPGDAYVDFVGSGVLNYGTAATWSKWWSFKEIFGNYYNQLAIFKKPIVISEFGSLAVGGDRSQWYAEALDSLQLNYPAVKSIIFFHYSEDRTTTQQPLNWYLTDDRTTLKSIQRGLRAIK
jgi:beta-mannanase